MTTFTTLLDQVEALYVAYLGHAGDPAGVNYWIEQLSSGALTLAQVAAAFASQPEATMRYPYLAYPDIADPGAFVDQVYRNLFNHAADPAGKAYWVAQLQASAGNPQAVGQFILNVISGATGADDAAIRNKVDVARDFTTTAANLGAAWTVLTEAQSSLEIATVDDSPETVSAAKAETAIFFATAPGARLVFTLQTDSLETTAARADFYANLIFNPPTGTLLQSLQPGDSAFDTGPDGMLTAVLNSGINTPLVTLQGIPTASVTSLAGGSGFNGNITGLTTLRNISSTGSLTLGTVGRGLNTALQTVSISGSAIGAGANTQAFMVAETLSGAADAVVLNVVGAIGTSASGAGAAEVVLLADGAAGTGAMPMNAYETETISSVDAAFLQLSNAASGVLSTSILILQGAGALQLSAAAAGDFANLTMIDASATTGGVTITGLTDVDSTGAPFNAGAAGLLTGNSMLTSFIGGSGMDRLDISSMTAAQVGAFAMLAGGGGRDTLVLDAVVLTSGTTVPSSGFEIIGASEDLAGTIDLAKLGTDVDTIQLFGFQLDTVTIVNAPSTFTLRLDGFADGEDYNVQGPAGSGDVLNIFDFFGFGEMRVAGFETINVTALGEEEILSIIATPTAGTAVTLNIIDNVDTCGCFFDVVVDDRLDVGSGIINVSGTGIGGVAIFEVTAATLNASALNPGAAPDDTGVGMGAGATGAISILGSNGSDFLVGSPVADLISGGPGDDFLIPNSVPAVSAGDNLTGGNGNDVFFLWGAVASGLLPTLYGSTPTLTDFRVDPALTAADLLMLSPDGDDYGVADLQADFTDLGDVLLQAVGSSGTTAVLDATNEMVKLSQSVATAGLTFQQAFDAAIGSATITGATPDGAYLFMMHDATNSRMAVGIVDASDGTIEAGDTVVLVGSANMSVSDYTILGTSQIIFDLPS